MDAKRSIPARRVVVEAAVAFLAAQRDLLRAGLEAATDEAVVADVTRRHEDSHEAWISTVATLRTYLPQPLVERVLELYGFHGRIAGGLAGERSLRLEGPIESGVRRILADQLDQLTADVIADLEAAVQDDPVDG